MINFRFLPEDQSDTILPKIKIRSNPICEFEMVDNIRLTTAAIALALGAGAALYLYSHWRSGTVDKNMEKDSKTKLEKEKPESKEGAKKETRRTKTKEEKVAVRVPYFHL